MAETNQQDGPKNAVNKQKVDSVDTMFGMMNTSIILLLQIFLIVLFCR